MCLMSCKKSKKAPFSNSFSFSQLSLSDNLSYMNKTERYIKINSNNNLAMII